MNAPDLIQVEDLKVHFPLRGGLPGRPREVVRAVDGVSFAVADGETVGVVGESGCGKSTLARALTRLVNPTGGRILVEGTDLARARGMALRGLRRKVQMVFQDPYSSLDPRLTVGESVGEALAIHRLTHGREERRRRIQGLFEAVGLDASQAERYPHEFSGGQRQRIGLARALAVEPRFIVCDEAVSALDVSIQAQIVNLLQDIQAVRGIAYLFIAHDLAVVEHMARRLLVMYLGKVVESGPAREVCRAPRHPYTQALVSAAPRLAGGGGLPRMVLGGDPPSPIHPPAGCPFHPRCPVAEARCRVEMPAWRQGADARGVACHLVP